MIFTAFPRASVSGVNAFLEPEIIFNVNPHMAAQKHAWATPEIHAANAEGRPDRIPWEVGLDRPGGFRIVGRAPWNARRQSWNSGGPPIKPRGRAVWQTRDFGMKISISGFTLWI
jgi:hypothetical protein